MPECNKILTNNEQDIDFEKQINEIRRPCIKQFFKTNNLLTFLKTHINISLLLQRKSVDNKKSLVEILNDIQKLTNNVLILESVDTIKYQINLNNEASNNISNNQTLYNETSNDISNNQTSSNQISQDNIMLNKLIESYPTSEIINHSDNNSNIIEINQNNKPSILLYLENEQTNVSKLDVEKFYDNMKNINSCGILCNVSGGIYNKEQFEIDIQNDNIYIFISNYNYDETLFKLAIKIIYHIFDIIKNCNNDCIEIDKELLQRLKIEYNYFLTTQNKHINAIKNNILCLEKLTLTQLDHFFKRTHLNSDDKPYSCQLCGTKFGTNKSLKTHLKIKHNIQLAKTRKIKDEIIDNDIITFN